MRRSLILTVSAAISVAACHRNQPHSAQAVAIKAERTVFTDSATHAKLCEPNQPGENWRLICLPKDQGVDVRVRPKQP